MHVLVVGATGQLGLPAARALKAAGHRVRGTARAPEKAAQLEQLGVEPISVDLYGAGDLRRAVDGCDAAIRLTTKVPPVAAMRRAAAWRETDRLRTEGSGLLVDAALAAGCQIYVHESVTFAYADGSDDWLDESAPINPGGWPPFAAAV